MGRPTSWVVALTGYAPDELCRLAVADPSSAPDWGTEKQRVPA